MHKPMICINNKVDKMSAFLLILQFKKKKINKKKNSISFGYGHMYIG